MPGRAPSRPPPGMDENRDPAAPLPQLTTVNPHQQSLVSAGNAVLWTTDPAGNFDSRDRGERTRGDNALRAGYDAHAAKPYNTEVLFALIASVTGTGAPSPLSPKPQFDVRRVMAAVPRVERDRLVERHGPELWVHERLGEIGGRQRAQERDPAAMQRRAARATCRPARSSLRAAPPSALLRTLDRRRRLR